MEQSLKSYVVFCRLWVVQFQLKLKEQGSVVACNQVVYKTEAELFKDIEIQINKLLKSKSLVQDISTEDAIEILKGNKSVDFEPSF